MNKYATDAKNDKASAKSGGAIHPVVEEMKTLVELDPQHFDAQPNNTFVNKDKDAVTPDVAAVGIAVLAASNHEEQKDSKAN